MDTCCDAPRPQTALRSAPGPGPRQAVAPRSPCTGRLPGTPPPGTVIGREVDRLWQRGAAGRVLVVVSVLSFALWAAGMGIGLAAVLA